MGYRLRGMALPARRLAALVLAALATSACGSLAPTPNPSPSEEPFVPPPPPAAASVVSCIGIGPGECAFVAGRVLGELRGIDGAPYSVQIRLARCPLDQPACPESLAARPGTALVEYPDGGEARSFRLAGPPGAPLIEPVEDEVWTDPIQPGSPRVEDSGPWVFAVGHCGLLHVVDFDGSFWVLVGHPEPEHQALIGSETGSIALLGPDRAQYLGTQEAAFQLARFPGAKRFQLCD